MKHEKFIYHSYTINENGFEYYFSMDEYEFRPRWTFGQNAGGSVPYDDPLLKELVFNLGMVELISYWKSACPPVVEVCCGALSEWQISWWKKLYRNGLGEFFYTNGIVPDEDFMTIIPADAVHAAPVSPLRELSGSLIPVGGGKDSIVTLELLRDSARDNHAYIVGGIKRAYDSAITAGYSERIIGVSRTIDPTLIELNRKGYLNGHTPFSAVIAFSALIFAYLNGKKYIVLSNESSADEGNTVALTPSGECSAVQVNHQYSKSTEFERDFREYVNYINPNLPNYFSLLRPWNELQITREFAKYPQYFPVFQSCNAGTKNNTWCNNCAKCLYVYIMLSLFIDSENMNKIFGENLLNKPELAPILHALKNPDVDKPFECVGTREEVNYALFTISGDMNKIENSDLLSRFNTDNFVPEAFLRVFDHSR
jgi:hypothetical protein